MTEIDYLDFPKDHRAGFVNILGRPNVGKSTLMNAMLGEKLSIITNKPQTTRHRILGLLNGENFQLVFSDTPGFIQLPTYKMHEALNQAVQSSYADGDVYLLIVEPKDDPSIGHPLLEVVKTLTAPVFLILNKSDIIMKDRADELIEGWKMHHDFNKTMAVSSLHKTGIADLLESLIEQMPLSPPYFPKDQISDKTERFFITEIIREQILEQYRQEIPYSCEVVVESFKETETLKGEKLVRINAVIFVERPTQKSILIGKGGEGIKKLGSEARKSMETFLESKVFLELFVKVKENWRNDEQWLNRFGYLNE
jgi:GTPase